MTRDKVTFQTKTCCEDMDCVLHLPSSPIIYCWNEKEQPEVSLDDGHGNMSLSFCPWCGQDIHLWIKSYVAERALVAHIFGYRMKPVRNGYLWEKSGEDYTLPALMEKLDGEFMP